MVEQRIDVGEPVVIEKKKRAWAVTPERRAKQVEVLERGTRVLELSRLGWTLREIAAEVGVSHITVRKDLLKAVARAEDGNRPAAKEFIAHEVARMEAIKDKLLAQMHLKERDKAPDLKAIDRYERLVHRQAQLLGVYTGNAPQQTNNGLVINIVGHTRGEVEADEDAEDADVVQGTMVRRIS